MVFDEACYCNTIASGYIVYSLWNIIAGDCFVSLKSCLMVSVELSMPYFFFPLGGRKTPQGEEKPLKIGWKPFLRPPSQQQEQKKGREIHICIEAGGAKRRHMLPAY